MADFAPTREAESFLKTSVGGFGEPFVCLLSLVLSLVVVPSSGAQTAPDDVPPEIQPLVPGVRLTLLAEHPALVTPTGIDLDEEGRLWVVATHTHFRPEDYAGPEYDEILVFEDADSDGDLEPPTVFYNRTVATMDLELGPDGWVYLAERDRILRVRDTNGDGRGDLEEDLAVLATEADYPHNGLSGLAWHPDGDLVFGLGENYAKPWTLTGTDQAEARGTGEGGIFRMLPDGTDMRRIARGFWNPFGVCVRDDGEMFAAENDPGARPPCRLLHVVEGGDYGFQRLYGGAAHHPFVCWNGGLRGTLPMVHPTGEAPCGVLPLGGGLVVPSWTDHRIDFYALKRNGAGFTADRIVLVRGGNHFRPVCIVAGEQTEQRATFYLTDWVFVSYQLHSRGRLWRLDIDLESADWLTPRLAEPPNAAAQLAARLRRNGHTFSEEQLFRWAADSDPYIANAALNALSDQANRWTPRYLPSLEADDQATAVAALKLATGSSRISFNGRSPAAPAEAGSPDVRTTPEEWVRHFLMGDDPEVVFETLRWIADEQLTTLQPDVEKLLTKSDLDFRLFEAAVAAWNTLSGKPDEGVQNADMLLRRVQDSSSAPRLRAYALRLLPTFPVRADETPSGPVTRFPKGLTHPLLEELLDIGDANLSLEVVRTLAGNLTAESQRILTRVARETKESSLLRAEAIAALASVADQHVPVLIRLAGSDQRAVREEALRSLRGVELAESQRRQIRQVAANHPESADLFIATLDPSSFTQGRPLLTDIEAWRTRLDAVPGPLDPQSGRRIFHHAKVAVCSRCHRHTGRGNVVGPDLTNISGSGDLSGLLESLLQPSLKVAPEYRARMLVLTDGRTFTGIHLRTGGGGDVETLRDANGQERRFPRDQIEQSGEVMTSLMPDGLPNSLTDRELRDLTAFLLSTTPKGTVP